MTPIMLHNLFVAHAMALVACSQEDVRFSFTRRAEVYLEFIKVTI